MRFVTSKWTGLGVVGLAVACVVGGGCLVGCSQDQEQEPTLMDVYQPKVTVRDDGVTIQRTPSEDISAAPSDTDVYHHPKRNVPKNTYYLNADERGCNACHEDLVNTVETEHYNHPCLSNDIGTEMTVDQCIDCHVDAYGATIMGSLGAIIHGIHADVEKADCWSCHYASESGEKMELWDVVKHDVLHGIKQLPLEGDFTYTQDFVMSQDQLPNMNWQYYEDDYFRDDNEAAGSEPDQELFDNWTISFSGLLDEQKTFTLAELAQRTDLMKTMVMAYPCAEYTLGGNLVGQAEVTGISLNDLLDELGVQEGAAAVVAVSSGGFADGFKIDRLEDNEAIIAFEINGQPLAYAHGYPCQLWLQRGNLPFFVKNLSEIVIGTEEDLSEHEKYRSIPCVGITNLDEGTVVKTGDLLTVEGYAYGFDCPVQSVDISIDNGNTWTSYPVEMDIERLVKWEYSIVPPEDGAYVIRVRVTLEDGSQPERDVSKLFNAQS